MSETNSTNDGFENLKKGTENAFESVKETAGEFANEAKDALDNLSADNKKIVAGILGILLGCFGVHKFILGYTKEGIIHIVLSLFCGLGGMLGLIEGIIYLTKTDEQFYEIYQKGRKPWF